MAEDESDVTAPLWMERYAEVTGFEWLGDRFVPGSDGSRIAPYLFVVTVWFLVTVGFATLRYLHVGRFPLLETPGMFVLLPAWLFVVFVARRMRDRYAEVVEGLPAPVRIQGEGEPRYAAWVRRFGVSRRAESEPLAEMFPGRLRWVLVAGGIGLHLAWFVIDPSPMQTFTQVYGTTLASLYFYAVVPGIFYVFGGELIALYLGVHVLLPLKVTMTDRIDFTDPLLYGGLRPVGRLLRDSSGAFLLLLSLFAVFETVSAGTDPLDPYSRLLVFGGIGFGVAMFVLPVYWLHRYLRGKKESKIREIKADIEDAGPEDDLDSLPEARPRTLDETSEYTHEYLRLIYVDNMKEFPIDVGLVLEFLFVLLLPYAAHVSSIFVFEQLIHL